VLLSYGATLIRKDADVAVTGGYRATGARGLREGDWTFWCTRVRTSGWGPACPAFESGGYDDSCGAGSQARTRRWRGWAAGSPEGAAA
jgi:hypothetical protein